MLFDALRIGGLLVLSGIGAHGAGAGRLPANAPSLASLAAQFEEPLVATGPSAKAADEDLRAALLAFRGRAVEDDFTALESFLESRPDSGWRVTILTNLGLSYYHFGYFSKALDAWKLAWEGGRQATDPAPRALADRAVGELARMHARLGHAQELRRLIEEIGGRKLTGPASEALAGAREGLWTMDRNPGVAYLCGPMAVKSLLTALAAPAVGVDELIRSIRSGPEGVTFAEVAAIANRSGLSHKVVRRTPGSAIPVPSVVHWKVTHFAAITGESGGRYRVQDPTFGADLWVTRGAIDSEASGYFLVPASLSNPGWNEATTQEIAGLRGMGYTGNSQPGATKETDLKARECGDAQKEGPKAASKAANAGMCGYNITEMLVSLTLSDTPVGYTPPKGPPVQVTLTYNQREASQPANFAWFNVGAKWTMNWISYIEDDPRNPQADVVRYVGGGGSSSYSGYDAKTKAYALQREDSSTLTRLSTAPIIYQRQLPDGSREVYAQTSGSTDFPRRVMLTQIFDAASNAVAIFYDGQLRANFLIDALGQRTTFSYDLPGKPFVVTKITDPFGRSAQFAYDSTGRLSQITDVLGLTSRFTYDAGSFVTSLVTPYGTTKFSYGENGNQRFLEATDPLGYTERVEYLQEAPGIGFSDPAASIPRGITAPFNQYLSGRNTFYWDKHAYASGKGDYKKARIRHWTHLGSNTNVTANSLESVKNPLENRVWLNYPGQPNSGLGTAVTGNIDKPSAAGRALDDGSTHLTLASYNTAGNVVSSTDTFGRETQFVHDATGIDLVEVKRKTSESAYSTTAKFTYNGQHRPLTHVDAAGKTTSYAYNSFGQLTQIVDPLGRVTKREYDGNGYLTRVVNPNNQAAATLSYDTSGRLAAQTDSEGRTVKLAYDALDRVVSETYPDGTSKLYAWNKLDLVSVKDRQGRLTQYVYDAVRHRVAVIDPNGSQTKFSYYENGRLKSMTDPNGNVTLWDIDIQGRVTAKRFADGQQYKFEYEAASGRLKSVTDPLGQVKQFTYTPDGLVAAIDYLNSVNPTPGVSFAYDPFIKRPVSMTDGSGVTLYQYQPVGSLGALQLAEENGPFQNSRVAYQYDALGRAIGRTIGSNSESFAYDALGRVTTHASDLGSFAYSYLGQTGQVASRRLEGGRVSADFAYESNTNDRRLKSIANGGSARSYVYTTTAEFLISAIAESTAGAAGAQWRYSYDSGGRLLTASAAGAEFAYGYDASGNIFSWINASGGNGANFNVTNQIVAVNDRSFAYDANGNLLDDGRRAYAWDAENRLISVALKDTPDQITSFRYDGLGRRIAIVRPGGLETRYHWCGERICQSRTASDEVSRLYFTEGESVAGGQRLYYAQDHLGSVRDVVGADGASIASYDYDPFGVPTDSGAAASADFRYAGMFFEAGTGLYLTHYRAYDPGTGRWLSRDPIGEGGLGSEPGMNPWGGNLYAYANGNPVANTDPSGLSTFGKILDWLGDKAVESILTSGIKDQLKNMFPDQPDFVISFFAGGIRTVAIAVVASGGGVLELGPPAIIAIFTAGGLKEVGDDFIGEQVLEFGKEEYGKFRDWLWKQLNCGPKPYASGNAYGEPGNCGTPECLLYMK